MSEEEVESNETIDEEVNVKGVPQWSPYFVPNGQRIYTDGVVKEDRHSVGNFLLPASMREIKQEELTRGLDALKGKHTGVPLGWEMDTSKTKGRDFGKGIPKWSPLYREDQLYPSSGKPRPKPGTAQYKPRCSPSSRAGTVPRNTASAGFHRKTRAWQGHEYTRASSGRAMGQLPELGERMRSPEMGDEELMNKSEESRLRRVRSASPYRRFSTQPRTVKSAAYMKHVIPKSQSAATLPNPTRQKNSELAAREYFGYGRPKSAGQSLSDLNPRERWDQRMKERESQQSLMTMRDMFRPLIEEYRESPKPEEDTSEAPNLKDLVFDESLFHAPIKRMSEYEKRDRGVGIPSWSPFKGDKRIDLERIYSTSHMEHGSYLKAQTKTTPRTLHERTRKHISEMKETMTTDHTWELIGARPKYMAHR